MKTSWGRTLRRIAAATAVVLGAAGTGLPAQAAEETFDGPPPIGNLTLTVDAATGKAGIADVDKSKVDVAALPLFTGGPEVAPIRSTPIRSTPIRSTPIRSTPIRSTPIRSTPLATMPIRSTPLTAAGLPPMPLSTVPVFVEGGWATLLTGTIYEGAALNAVTLQQALALDAPAITALTLNDIDIASTPLRQASLQGFLFAGPTLDELSSTYDWCGTLSGDFDCAAHGIDEATSTLLDLDLAGAPLHRLWFLPTLTVDGGDITGSPLAFFDIGAMDLTGTPLDGVIAADVPDIVNCEVFTCTEIATLGEAVRELRAGHETIFKGATLGDLIYRENRVYDADLRFDDLLTAVIDPTKLAYDNMPMLSLLTALPDPTPQDAGLVRYTAAADVQCHSSDDLFIAVALPRTFTYVPGSATKTLDNGTPMPAGEPLTGSAGYDGTVATTDTYMTVQRSAIITPTNVVRWFFGDEFDCTASETAVAEHVQLSFLVRPGVELGTKTASVAMSSFTAPTTSVINTAPYTVGEALEPNDSITAATPITANSMYLSHIGDGDDVDYYTLPAGLAEGTRITATLSHLPADFDLFITGPRATAFNATAAETPLRQFPTEDFGPTDVATPEGLQDLPIRSTPLSMSDNRALETEVVSTIVRHQTTAPYTITVGHHLGSNSAAPYLLQVTLDPPPELTCATGFSLGTGGVRGSLPNKATLDPQSKTVFLVNQKRMGDAYGATAAATAITALEGLAARDEVKGVILPVDGDATVAAAYATWDGARCSPDAANDVVRPIVGVLHDYLKALPNVQYVVTVGNDDIVPFGRELDNVTLSNQRDYLDSVRFPGGDTPTTAAAAYGMVLTDNVYTDLDVTAFLTGQLLDPDLAGGRLVETPAEITAAVQQYATQPYVDMSKTLTTGYDFVQDLATAVTAKLTAQGATATALVSDDWTREQLLTALDEGPTVASINAHYDHANALPAHGNSSLATDPTLFSSNDLATSGLDLGALLYTVGCNAGLNVPGSAWVATGDATTTAATGATDLDDFAQVLARDKRAIGFLANTGFGYGDTDLIAYGERFLQLFTERLDGTMTVGQAVVQARKAYTRESALGVYDQKVVNESTFYGFPFAKVGATGAELPKATAATGAALPVDPKLGVQAASFDKDITLTPHETPGGVYYTANGQTPTAVHYRPVQPALGITLPPTPAGKVQGDVLITGLTSGPELGASDPVISVPTSDRGAFDPEVTLRDAAFPVPAATTSATGGVQLFPAQYRSEGSEGPAQQTFSEMTGKVLYPTTLSGPRPSFADVEAATLGESSTAFRIEARDADYMLVLYRTGESATWATLELTALPATAGATARTWTGVASTPNVTEFFVQGVRDGQVGTTRAKGFDFTPATPSSSGLSITVNGTQQNGWFRTTPLVTATGAENVVFEASVDGNDYAPIGTGLALNEPGLHVVEIRGSDGSTGTTYVAVDTTAPTVTITNPVQGQRVRGATPDASFTCADVGSGIDSCTALDPVTLDTTVGPHDFRVKAIDKAGNETLVTVTYIGGYDFEGYFAPVENPSVWNVVQAGSNVPMKFRVKEPNGTLVTTTAVVTSSVSERIPCSTGDTSVVTPDLLDTTSQAGLRYDERDTQFVYTWKSSKAWVDTCRKFVLTLDDGSTHPALFRFN